jgi:hypothetical protein
MLSMDYQPRIGLMEPRQDDINFKKTKNDDRRYKRGEKDTEVRIGNATNTDNAVTGEIGPNNPEITPDNSTYEITNPGNDTRCTAECWINCQVHFPDITEQKFCILNVCHCQIREKPIAQVNITIIPPSNATTELSSLTTRTYTH